MRPRTIREDPDQPQDADEEDQRDAETASAGGCFVATAAYGSWSHPDVVALRRFRDEVLTRHAAGRAFIRAYRIVGPKLARLVSAEAPVRPGRAGADLAARAPRPGAGRSPRLSLYRRSPSARCRARPLSTSDTPRRFATSRISPCSSALIPSAAATRQSASTTPVRSS